MEEILRVPTTNWNRIHLGTRPMTEEELTMNHPNQNQIPFRNLVLFRGRGVKAKEVLEAGASAARRDGYHDE